MVKPNQPQSDCFHRAHIPLALDSWTGLREACGGCTESLSMVCSRDRCIKSATALSICEKGAPFAGRRAIKSTSHPVAIKGKRRRMHSLITRRVRLRTTALPSLRLTENAKRLSGRSLARLIKTSQRLCHERPCCCSSLICKLLVSRYRLLSISLLALFSDDLCGDVNVTNYRLSQSHAATTCRRCSDSDRR